MDRGVYKFLFTLIIYARANFPCTVACSIARRGTDTVHNKLTLTIVDLARIRIIEFFVMV